MASSVCERLSARQAGCPCRVSRLSVLAQVSGHISHIMTNQGVLLVAALSLILFSALVVLPAVWSSKPARRKAALAVLDRLLRWRW
jgi:hypothetical protein